MCWKSAFLPSLIRQKRLFPQAPSGEHRDANGLTTIHRAEVRPRFKSKTVQGKGPLRVPPDPFHGLLASPHFLVQSYLSAPPFHEDKRIAYRLLRVGQSL